MLSLTAQPGYLLIPARTDTTPCEYLSLDVMERWILCKTVNKYHNYWGLIRTYL